MNKPKLIRITTVPVSLKTLLKGQHRYMSAQGIDIMGVSSAGEELEEVRQSEGIPVISLEMTRTISPLHDLKSLWKFYRLCRKERPSIVHSHTPKAGIVGMLGAKLAGVPIRLHTVAGLPLMEKKGYIRTVLNFVEKLTYASATKVYPNSKVLMEYILQQKYTSPGKLHVIGNGSSNGIDTQFFAPGQIGIDQRRQLKVELGITEDDFIFVFVGRMVGDKGINELIRAFVKLSQTTPNIKLLLVGPLESKFDPLHPSTHYEIDNHPHIITVGFQNDVRPYFAISDALTFPSYREGFPNVVLQAGSMELPCIVSDINGCNEIIIDGENGTIIPSKDSEALLVAMKNMLDDPSYYSHLKSNARTLITSRYEQNVVWESLLEEYKNLLGEKSWNMVMVPSET